MSLADSRPINNIKQTFEHPQAIAREVVEDVDVRLPVGQTDPSIPVQARLNSRLRLSVSTAGNQKSVRVRNRPY